MDMAVAAHISVEEYLNSSYEPDMEYVDGELVEINVGDRTHSLVQSNLVYFLRLKYPNIKVLPEVRSRTTETRFRLPDVAVELRRQTGRFITEPPYIAIEILSEDDRVSRLIEKLKEYAAMGVPNIWVFDPRLKQMFVFEGNALREIEGDTISTGDPRIELTRAEVFQD
jgi:Uma2 family endonuclease